MPDCMKCFTDMRCQKTGKTHPCDDYAGNMLDVRERLSRFAEAHALMNKAGLRPAQCNQQEKP